MGAKKLASIVSRSSYSTSDVGKLSRAKNCPRHCAASHRREDNSRVRYLNQFEPARTDVDYLKPLKTEEARLRAVIEHDYPEHLPEFELALSTGLRKGSMYSLTWAMVDWTGRMLNIPTSKNGEALHIPLNNAAWQR
jgi:integrase